MPFPVFHEAAVWIGDAGLELFRCFLLDSLNALGFASPLFLASRLLLSFAIFYLCLLGADLFLLFRAKAFLDLFDLAKPVLLSRQFRGQFIPPPVGAVKFIFPGVCLVCFLEILFYLFLEPRFVPIGCHRGVGLNFGSIY